MNLVQAQLAESGDGLAVARRRTGAAVPAETCRRAAGAARYAGRTVGLGIRPEHLREANGDGGVRLRGAVRATEALGSEFLVHLEVAAEPVLTEEVREVAGDVDAAALRAARVGGEGAAHGGDRAARDTSAGRPSTRRSRSPSTRGGSTSSTSTPGSRSTTRRDRPDARRVDGAARPAGGRRVAARHAPDAALRGRRVELRDRARAARRRRRRGSRGSAAIRSAT